MAEVVLTTKRRDRPGSDVRLRICMVGLFSEKYPAIGETHGLSVVAGALLSAFRPNIDLLEVNDLVSVGREDDALVHDMVERLRPNVLAISVPYGTYDFLGRLTLLISRQLDRGTLVILGGSLPTYLGERILHEIDSRLLISIGEGDQAIVQAVARWATRGSSQVVPNLLEMDSGRVVEGPRVLVDPADISRPYRGHLQPAVARGAQIFAESTRACS